MASAGAKNIRSEERVPSVLPVILDRGTGITRDISASGVYFETERNYARDSEIDFAIELDGPTGTMILKCQGRIVRVEGRSGSVGVAAKIIESRLEMVKDINSGGE